MPADLVHPPRPWRLSSRLLVVDDGRLLVMRAFDPTEPLAGQWYEIPGGGVEPGETTAAAAVRETAEESGYRVPADAVGEACWHGETTYTWLGRRHWAEMVMHVARVSAPLPRGATAWVEDEADCFVEAVWLPLDDVVAGRGRFFPGTLPGDLPRVLSGEHVETGFTVWS